MKVPKFYLFDQNLKVFLNFEIKFKERIVELCITSCNISIPIDEGIVNYITDYQCFTAFAVNYTAKQLLSRELSLITINDDYEEFNKEIFVKNFVKQRKMAYDDLLAKEATEFTNYSVKYCQNHD